MPKKQDMVLLGVEYENNFFHIATLPWKYFQWFQNTLSSGPGSLIMRKLQEGETEISACDSTSGLQSCSIALLQDGTIEMDSKYGSKKFNKDDGNIEEGYHSISSQDTTRLIIGQVERDNTVTGVKNEIKALGGVPYTGVGNALNEAIIAVGQSKNASGDDFGTPTASIHVSDQILDDNGTPVLTLDGKSIQVDIQMKSGAHIQIDEDGGININEANPLTYPSKMIARNGDNVETVIASTYSDPAHPGQAALASSNVTQMSTLVSNMVITIPSGAIQVTNESGPSTNPLPIVLNLAITYNPTNPVKLTGEIVQGASGVLIGDMTPAPIPV
jgi:uncharacterized protein Veg